MIGNINHLTIRIQARFFKYENQLDLQLSRKLTLLKLLDIEACKLNQSNHLELKKLLIQSSLRLIQFEDSKTPTSKLKQLQLFIIEIIVSSLKFTQKLCFSPTLQGIDSFNLILLESCINWIINFEIGMDDKLLLKDVHGVEAGGSSTVYHDSILNELGQFATQVSKSFWSSDMIQFNPTNYTKTDVPLTNTFKIKKVDGNVGDKLREQLRTSK
ncbi:hypothetical protein HDV02_006438 [Globomyces sp. JEL0801]|nr:hypothetical protein HDV02_006438 [Globomyces sp. JEL0801]